MHAKQINEKALDFLSKQNWGEAQNLFFYNAKHNPTHETYNNLGFYLITEGLLCKNGRTRNALKLGIKYLLKSESIKASFINICAITKSIDYQLREEHSDKKRLYVCACEYLKKGLAKEYSNVLQYNLLRFSYLLTPQDIELSIQANHLLKKFPCRESVLLYFELLRAHNLMEAGLECISKYKIFLDEIELIMFYSKFGLYEQGYNLCKSVYNMFSIDEFVASAIIECCVNTNHLIEAEKYAIQIKQNEKDMNPHYKADWCSKIVGDSIECVNYRKDRVQNYHFCPPIIETCCYFGCPVHKTVW